MATRKTVYVSTLVSKANKMIEHAPTPEERTGIAVFLESILHDTGNYRGFTYPSSEIDPDTHQFKSDGDDTRRIYYYREA